MAAWLTLDVVPNNIITLFHRGVFHKLLAHELTQRHFLQQDAAASCTSPVSPTSPSIATPPSPTELPDTAIPSQTLTCKANSTATKGARKPKAKPAAAAASSSSSAEQPAAAAAAAAASVVVASKAKPKTMHKSKIASALKQQAQPKIIMTSTTPSTTTITSPLSCASGPSCGTSAYDKKKASATAQRIADLPDHKQQLVELVVSMGYTEHKALSALLKEGWLVDYAVNRLLLG
jgi:hypothetical protein